MVEAKAASSWSSSLPSHLTAAFLRSCAKLQKGRGDVLRSHLVLHAGEGVDRQGFPISPPPPPSLQRACRLEKARNHYSTFLTQWWCGVWHSLDQADILNLDITANYGKYELRFNCSLESWLMAFKLLQFDGVAQI